MLRPIIALTLGLTLTVSSYAEVVITFGGDLNLTQTRQSATAYKTSKHGQVFTWDELYSGISPLLIGDLNFANLETVISDQKNLRDAPSPSGKKRTYAFISPPEGIAAGMQRGLNLFSTANNHTADYGTNGMLETMFHTFVLSSEYKFWESGLASTREQASTPALIELMTSQGPVRIAFLAMTAVHGEKERAARDSAPIGILSFFNEGDFSAAMKGLREAQADYRILSVHWGKEGSTQIRSRERQWAHRALNEGDVDLILGHHPHRVQPVEKVGDKLIFYSLGNYLMVGAANINGNPADKDYGLMGRLYLNYDAARGKLVPQALEAIPLTDLHQVSKPMSTVQANERISILNRLGRGQVYQNAIELKPTRLGGQSCWGMNPGPKAMRLCGQ